MLPMGSIFFPLIVAPLCYVETYSNIQKLIFDDMDTNIIRRCVHLLLIVYLISKLYSVVLCFGNFCFYRQKRQIKTPTKYMCFTV